jgi:glutathione S-transferase
MKLYMTPRSGNAAKPRLLLAMLGIPYEQVLISIADGEHKNPEFLKLNPRGQVPVLEDDGHIFWDSTACLVYIARKHGGDQWLPDDAAGLAEVMQWLALAQNEIHYGLQWARGVIHKFKRGGGDLAEYQAYGRAGLAVLERHLKNNEWLALARPTIADIACYPYVAVSDEGGVTLDPYPHVAQWVTRCEALPGWFKPIRM